MAIGNKTDGFGVFMRTYDCVGWKLSREIGIDGIGLIVDISPDEKMIATGDATGDLSGFRIVSLETGKVVAQDVHHAKTKSDKVFADSQMITFVTHIEFSPNQRLLLTGGEDNRIKVWSLQNYGTE